MPRRKPWTDSTFQKLPLEALSIDALNRVLDMRSEYDLEFQQYQARRAPIEAEKRSLRIAISSVVQERFDVDFQLAQVVAQLAPFEANVVGKWLFSQPTIQAGARSYRPEAQSLVARWHMLCKRRNELNELSYHSQYLQQKLQLQKLEDNREYEPTKQAKLRFQSQTFIFDISAIDVERIERIIEKKSDKIELDSTQEQNRRRRAQITLGLMKAKAAAYENKQRGLAKSVRTPTALRRQLNDNPNCPYCNLELSTKDAHADHIHPVVKGGLSTTGNMVFVCQSCNVTKGTLTLRMFLKKMGYVEGDVYDRLERMGKDV